MDDVKDFFKRYYHPANAILVVAGDIEMAKVLKLVEKWFADIPAGPVNHRNLREEPMQKSARKLEINAKVPVDAFYQVYHMPKRYETAYYEADLFCDILGRGKSSRLYQKLVKERNIFSSLSANVTGSLDPGLVVIQGKLAKGKTCEQGHQEVTNVIEQLLSEGVPNSELEKVKNQAESTLAFSEVTVLNRCLNLAMAAVAGDPQFVNRESDIIRSIKRTKLMEQARTVFRQDNSSTLYYKQRPA
jgi:predicted Zn-dependent peptidase